MKLPASLQTSAPDVYKMDTDPRGYVCILNYSSFKDRTDLHIAGSETDVRNLADVFEQMGYAGHNYSSLTADQTRQVLTSVRDMEVLDHVGCAVFIISSHGHGKEEFLTSDLKHLTTQWVKDLFKDSECPKLKNKPKLFIFDFSNGYYKNQISIENSRTKCKRVSEPLRDMMCLYSSGGDFTAHSFSGDGTAFTRTLCQTLVQHAHNKEFGDLFREFLVAYQKTSPSFAPQLCNIGFTKKFYFNPATGSLRS